MAKRESVMIRRWCGRFDEGCDKRQHWCCGGFYETTS